MRQDDDSLFGEFRIVPRPARWIFVAARSVFAVCVVVGAITFVLHWIALYAALHYGAAVAGGDQLYRIANHGDSRFVTYPVALCLKVFSLCMLIGLGVGMAGEVLLRLALRRFARVA
jgi:hypothetical protein